MWVEHRGWCVETFYQQSAFFVGRIGCRSADGVEAACAKPGRRTVEQRRSYFLVVNGFKEPEEADPVLVELVVGTVLRRHDAAHDFSVPFGQEKIGVSMLEIGMFFFVEQFLYIHAQRRDPQRVPPVQPVWEVDEAAEIFFCLDFAYDYCAAQMIPISLPTFEKISMVKSIWS